MDTSKPGATLNVVSDREFEIVNARGLRVAGVRFNSETHDASIYTQSTRLRRDVAELLGAGLVAYYQAREELENPVQTVTVDVSPDNVAYRDGWLG